MATIENMEEAKMGARGRIAKGVASYRERYSKPKRRQALAAMWAKMSPEMRERFAEAEPDAYAEIMSYMKE